MTPRTVPPLYRPVQPGGGAPGVCYREYAPAVLLSEHIYCYWELRDAGAAENFCYRIVADGCMDVFMNAADQWREQFVAKNIPFAFDVRVNRGATGVLQCSTLTGWS